MPKMHKLYKKEKMKVMYMLETAVILTPLHYVYLLGVIVILTVMILRLDTPPACILFLFLIGLLGFGTVTGGIQTVFSAILYAAREFMEVIATIALVTALSKCLAELGSSRLLMAPMTRIMKTPSLTWWILGGSMFLFSLFLWPSPSVALVGAIMLPFAVQAGLNPLMAGVAINLFGHGFALSYDVIVQGAPAVSAKAAGISAGDILSQGGPLFWTMGLVTAAAAFLIHRKEIRGTAAGRLLTGKNGDAGKRNPIDKRDPETDGKPGTAPDRLGKPSQAALAAAILTPLAFLADIGALLVLDLKGGDATSLVSGTALVVMCICSFIGYRGKFFQKVTGYVTDGFLFAIRIFAPVIVIGAFFFLGGQGLNAVMGQEISGGLMNDWALWLASHAPISRHGSLLIQMIVGGLTGLDGSGFSGLPLTGALAQTFGLATGASVPVLAAAGQITAVFVGGGTIVPWGLIPVAAICNVDPLKLAGKNLVPVMIGFFATFLLGCLLL